MWTNLLADLRAPKGQYYLLAPHSALAKPVSQWAAPRKDQDFPAYIVDVTRNTLLSFTTSLTKTSSQAHDFFSGLSQYFAFERMMRNCFGWAMPATLSPMTLGMPQWPVPHWFSPIMPRPQPKALSWWGAEMLALPKPQPKPEPVANLMQAAMTAAGLPIYGALLAMPAAFFTLAPAMMRAWSIPG